MAEQRKAWQGGGKSGGEPAGGRDWQRGGSGGGGTTPKRPGGPPWWQSTRVQIFAVVMAMCAVAGVWVAVVLWPRPAPLPGLILIEAGYEKNPAVPHNVAGRNTARALKEWWDGAKFLTSERQQDKAVEVRLEGDRALEPIEKMVTGGKPVKKVVVVVTAYGVAVPNDEGVPVPHLVPQGYAPGDSVATLVPVDRLIDLLARLPDEARKLLVLDVSGYTAAPALGQYAQAFGHALNTERYQKRVEAVKGLVIIASSSEGQPSWASPDRRVTAFGHYLLEGLRGAADEGGNGSVSAWELHSYLKTKVERWSRHNRERVQVPLLMGPEDRARGFDVVMNTDRDRNAPEAELPTAPSTDDAIARDVAAVGELWAECKALQASAPWALRPYLWRRYLDSLLRAEELARAGDQVNSAEMRNECKRMAATLGHGPARPRDSIGLTTAMAAAFAPVPPAQLAQFDNLLRGRDFEAARKIAAKLKENVASRMAMMQKVLVALAEQKPATWKGELKEQQGLLGLLGELDDVTAPYRPLEPHLVAMAVHETAPKLTDDAALWRRMVTLRVEAEQAAVAGVGQAELVSPWARKLIDQADKLRRPAQDLLFTSQKDSWDDAGKRLEEAAGLYARAKRTAEEVGEALAVRDRAMAELPYLTRLVAEQSSENQDQLDLKAAWARLFELDAGLTAMSSDTVKLARDGAVVKEYLSKARQFAEDQRRTLLGAQPTQRPLHQIESALRVPFADPAERASLIKKARDISFGLLQGMQQAGEAKGAEEAMKLARAEARRLAQVAVTMSYDADRDRDEMLKTIPGEAEPGVLERSLCRLGAELVKKRLKVVTEVMDLTGEADGAKLPEARKKLAAAAAAARRVAGWAVNNALLSRHPVEEWRKLLLHDLLVWQAERAFHDHWVGERAIPGGAPYYRAVADLFLADARRQVNTDDPKSPRLARVNEAREAMSAEPLAVEWARARPGPFAAGDGAFHMTDELNIERYYRLKGPGNVEGHSVRWVSVDKGLSPPAQDGVRPWALGQVHPLHIKAENELYKRNRRTPKHTVAAYFRGQRASAAMAVTVHREPDHLVVAPPIEPRGRLAIVAENRQFERYAASRYAVAIVLDCSYSMVKNKIKGTDRSRWDVAKETLRAVLSQLPRGVSVSLRAFGAKGFTSYKLHGGIELIWPTHSWEPDDLDRRMKQIHALEPAHATPLMRTMRLARDDLSKNGMATRYKGRRTLVVITDGGDFNFYNPFKYPDMKTGRVLDTDLKTEGRDTITKFLRKSFDAPYDDISLNVIDFDADPKEMEPFEKKAYEELEPALNGLRKATPKASPRTINYERATNATMLAAALTKSMLRLDFLMDADVSRPKFDRPPLRGVITRVDRVKSKRETLSWVNVPFGLGQNRYDIREFKAFIPLIPDIKQRIRIEPGDALVLELTGRGEVARYRRWMYINSLATAGAFTVKAEPLNDWTLGAVENFQEGSGGRLRTMATLEKNLGAADPDSHIQQIHPTFTWFELADSKGRSDRPLRVVSQAHYPAPAFGMEVPFWPSDETGGEPVTMRTWWSQGTPRMASHLVLRGSEVLLGQRERKLDLERPEDEVILESVAIETCRVPYRQDGSVEPEVKDCLVVRLRYPPKSGPYFARVGADDWQGGVAHRFFHEAGKTTSIFWPATGDAKRIQELRVYNVTELKSRAMSRTMELGRPGPGNTRPEVPK